MTKTISPAQFVQLIKLDLAEDLYLQYVLSQKAFNRIFNIINDRFYKEFPVKRNFREVEEKC